MTQDNPFARLGALDQKLYQETTNSPQTKTVDKYSEENSNNNKQENASLLSNQQTNKPAKKKTDLLVNQQTRKLTNQQTSTQPLSTKEKKKYGTYLREDSILQIQVHAIQTKRKDHEVLQEAVDFYFINFNK